MLFKIYGCLNIMIISQEWTKNHKWFSKPKISIINSQYLKSQISKSQKYQLLL